MYLRERMELGFASPIPNLRIGRGNGISIAVAMGFTIAFLIQSVDLH